MKTIPKPCPTCGGETGRHFDENLKPTGKRICLQSLICPQLAFWYIPSAQEIEQTGRVLGPMREADLDWTVS
jgi:hypothetical protein